ncbi:MAG: hypothetical protein L3J74_13045 [Bacteroidales bacterium]|nr:hypothetical protein [Bacteroidales bacterium]
MIRRLFFILILFFFNSNLISAQETDSTNVQTGVNFNELSVGTSSLSNFEDKYLLETELAHQKLLRNIFMISFGFLFAALMFIIFYYGSKVKKINDLIVLQNNQINAVRDQLQKIITVFDHVDRLVFITDEKGRVEWANIRARKDFTEDFLKSRISLLEKFSDENQGKLFQSINKVEVLDFNDNLYKEVKNWKMIPITNSANEFANMVFIGS